MSALSTPLAPAAGMPRAHARTLASAVAVIAVITAIAALAFASLSSERAIAASVAGAALVIASVVDMRRGDVPDRIAVCALLIVLASQLALFPGEVAENLLVALAAAFVLALPALAGRSWLGLGDVKLVLLAGVALGWGVLGAVLIGFVSVLPVALVLMARGGLAARATMLPFGPFLTLGSLVILCGPALAGIS